MDKTDNEIIEIAYKLLNEVSEKTYLEGQDKILNLIKCTNDNEQKKDYLVCIYLASVLCNVFEKIVFEEKWFSNTRKVHDLVTYHSSGTRIVNEVKRLRQTRWDEIEFQNCILKSVLRTGELYELKEDPNRSTTGFLDTILKEVSKKENQLEPNAINIIWFSSHANHYQASDIEDVAEFYANGRNKLQNGQPGKFHFIPEHLSGLGWFFDGHPDSTSSYPECFLIKPSKVFNIFKNIIKVRNLFNGKE